MWWSLEHEWWRHHVSGHIARVSLKRKGKELLCCVLCLHDRLYILPLTMPLSETLKYSRSVSETLLLVSSAENQNTNVRSLFSIRKSTDASSVFLAQLLVIIALLLVEVLLPPDISILSIPYKAFLCWLIPEVYTADSLVILHPYITTGLLFVSVTTLVLFFASGMYSEKIAYANKYVLIEVYFYDITNHPQDMSHIRTVLYGLSTCSSTPASHPSVPNSSGTPYPSSSLAQKIFPPAHHPVLLPQPLNEKFISVLVPAPNPDLDPSLPYPQQKTLEANSCSLLALTKISVKVTSDIVPLSQGNMKPKNKNKWNVGDGYTNFDFGLHLYLQLHLLPLRTLVELRRIRRRLVDEPEEEIRGVVLHLHLVLILVE